MICWDFECTYLLITETSNWPINVNSFLPDIIFDLEDGGDMFLRNFGLSADCTASQPRRLHPYFSWYFFFSEALATGNITGLRTSVKVNAVDMSWLYLTFRGICLHCLSTHPSSSCYSSRVSVFRNLAMFAYVPGPFVSALANRYGFRTVCILGSVLGGIGFAFSYFANSVTYLFFSYGVLGGKHITPNISAICSLNR
jgi:hypothetical protein